MLELSRSVALESAEAMATMSPKSFEVMLTQNPNMCTTFWEKRPLATPHISTIKRRDLENLFAAKFSDLDMG